MTRLLVLVVLAAVIVPTTVLAGPRVFRGFSVLQVKRAFASEGIRLHRDRSETAQFGWADLVGRLRDKAQLDVKVRLPKPYPWRASSDAFIVYSTASGRPLFYGAGARANVLVDWMGNRCGAQSQVRAALDGLALPPNVDVGRWPVPTVRCIKLPQYP